MFLVEDDVARTVRLSPTSVEAISSFVTYPSQWHFIGLILSEEMCSEIFSTSLAFPCVERLMCFSLGPLPSLPSVGITTARTTKAKRSEPSIENSVSSFVLPVVGTFTIRANKSHRLTNTCRKPQFRTKLLFCLTR